MWAVDEGLPSHTATGADSAPQVRDAAVLSVPTEVVVCVELVEVAHAVDVAWIEYESVCLGTEARKKGEGDDE